MKGVSSSGNVLLDREKLLVSFYTVLVFSVRSWTNFFWPFILFCQKHEKNAFQLLEELRKYWAIAVFFRPLTVDKIILKYNSRLHTIRWQSLPIQKKERYAGCRFMYWLIRLGGHFHFFFNKLGIPPEIYLLPF